MNFLQMHQFQIIAENESITKAADKLFISSPSLSKTLKNIEQEFNCSLFDRVGRHIYINRNGEVLLEYINTLVNVYGDMLKYFGEKNIKHYSSLVICDLGENYMDIPINLFSRKYPYIQIKRETTSFEKAIEMLLKKEADIIFADQLSIDKYREELTIQNIDSTFLFSNNLFLVVSPESKYARLKEIDLNQLKSEKLLTIREDKNTYLRTGFFVEHVLEAENIKINFAHYFDLDYAYRNLFFTSYLYFSDSLHINYYSDFKKYKKFIRISNNSARQDIYICYRSKEPPVSIFAAILKETFINIFTTQ